MQSQVTRAEFTILAAGIALIVGSFAPFYSFRGTSATVNAWDTGLSPIALYPLFAGVALGVPDSAAGDRRLRCAYRRSTPT